jgi:hypothetical protein
METEPVRKTERARRPSGSGPSLSANTPLGTPVDISIAPPLHPAGPYNNDAPNSNEHSNQNDDDDHFGLDSTDDSGVRDETEFHNSDGTSGLSASAISRKQFRETIGNDFARDLLSGEYSYDEIIRKYKEMYPQHADKFTRNFCSKVRCGRILNTSRTMKQRSVKNGDPRMKRVTKISKRKEWTRMTPELV